MEEQRDTEMNLPEERQPEAGEVSMPETAETGTEAAAAGTAAELEPLEAPSEAELPEGAAEEGEKALEAEAAGSDTEADGGSGGNTNDGEKNSRRRMYIILAAVAVVFFVLCGLIGCGIGTRLKKQADAVPSETETESFSEIQTESEVESTSEPESEPESESESESESETKTEPESEAETEPESGKAAEPSTAAATEPSASSESGSTSAAGDTPVAAHGQLSVSGTQMVDQYGQTFQLRGVSTHGIAWFPEYVNYEAFQTMRDEWGVNAVRLAMYTAESSGYCTGGDQNYLKGLVKNGVSYATELGMYVIIDWHVLNDNNPNTYKSQAIEFFTEMATLYRDNNNVIYEICNEPCNGTSWSEIKSYANDVIATIRAIDPDAIIIVGTPNWSQQVDQAAADPITGYSNIMYALHFYAATHTDSLRQTMVSAINAGLPVIVSEYGICDASGSGGIDEAQANQWVSVMNQYGVSYMIWNLSNKNETSALISSSCSKTSGWSYDELSASGKWFVNMMGTAAQIGSSNTAGNNSGGSGSTGSSNSSSSNSSNSNSNNSNSSGSTQSSTGTSQQASSSNCSVTASCTNEWSADDGTHQQYTVQIVNTSSSEISNWSVVLTFSAAVSVDQSWGGQFSVSGSQITITPESWNGTIAANSACSDVGMIVITSGTLTGAAVSN